MARLNFCFHVFMKIAKKALYNSTDLRSVFAKRKFVKLMNKTAKQLCMHNSKFHNATGASNKSYSTSYDLYLLGKEAASHKEIVDIWTRKEITISIKGDKSRTISVNNNVLNLGTDIMIPYLIGGKSGTWGTRHKSHIFLCNINDKKHIITIMAKDESSFNNIYEIGFELCEFTKGVPLGKHSTTLIENDGGYFIFSLSDNKIISAKNEKVKMLPASTTKVLSILCLIHTGIDKTNEITIHKTDIAGGSGSKFFAGDILTVSDAMHLMMLESSNTATNALARVAGYHL